MKKKKRKIILGGLLAIILFLIGSYFYNNITYIEKPLKEMYRAGFVEKQVELKDGSLLITENDCTENTLAAYSWSG